MFFFLFMYGWLLLLYHNMRSYSLSAAHSWFCVKWYTFSGVSFASSGILMMFPSHKTRHSRLQQRASCRHNSGASCLYFITVRVRYIALARDISLYTYPSVMLFCHEAWFMVLISLSFFFFSTAFNYADRMSIKHVINLLFNNDWCTHFFEKWFGSVTCQFRCSTIHTATSLGQYEGLRLPSKYPYVLGVCLETARGPPNDK